MTTKTCKAYFNPVFNAYIDEADVDYQKANLTERQFSRFLKGLELVEKRLVIEPVMTRYGARFEQVVDTVYVHADGREVRP